MTHHINRGNRIEGNMNASFWYIPDEAYIIIAKSDVKPFNSRTRMIAQDMDIFT